MQKPQKTKLPFILKLSAAIAFTILLLTMLPAAMPENDEAEREDISYPYDDQRPDDNGVARPDEFPHLVMVYPAGDSWGHEAAVQLKARLASRFHAHFVILSDIEYLSLDGDMLYLYNSYPSLTLSIGVTALLEESYLSVLTRLGRDGLQISRDENRINIISASFTRVSEGCKAFADALGYDGELKISDSLYMIDAHPSSETDHTPDIISDEKVRILTFSYIDSDPHTIRAIEGIVEKARPHLVVFNGNVDGGAETRRELAAMWQTISDALAKTQTPWCFTPGELTGGLPRITVCQVISSFPGCIKDVSGETDAGYEISVANTRGEVTASIYVGDIFENNSALCAEIKADTVLYERASDTERKVIAILPAISTQLFDTAQSLPEDRVREELNALHAALENAGVTNYICSGGTQSPALIRYEGGSAALCGSIGFTYRGLGGRFDYNNSLRCGLLLTLYPARTEGSISYIYAADLGLNER